MRISETLQGKIWNDTAKQLSGKLYVTYQQINGGLPTGGLYLFKILVPYKSLIITISTGFEELALKYDEIEFSVITITAKKEKKDTIELSIWRKDFFDKIFGKGLSKTGYKEFDNVIGLKVSKNIERFLPKIFENTELRNELINDKYRTYNVQTIDGEIVIQRKSALRMKDSEMIIDEYNRFILFVEGLVNANIIL